MQQMTRRTPPQPLTINISKEAADHVRQFAAQAGKPDSNLRVGVKGGGCSGLTYVLDLVDEPGENDKTIEEHGIQLYVDKKSYVFLAGTVLEEMFDSGKSLEEVVAARGRQISDTDALADIAREVMAANPQAVADYHAGKDRAVQFLMGQVMRRTRGQANPGKVTELLRVELDRDRGE